MSLWRGGPRGAYPTVVFTFAGLQGNRRSGDVVAEAGDYTLESLGDVSAATPTAGQVLYFNAVTQLWEARNVNDPPPGTPPNVVPPHTLDDHTDVDVPNPLDKQYLQWDAASSSWIAVDFSLSAVNFVGTIDVTAVPAPAAAQGDAYVHNGPSGAPFDASWNNVGPVEPGNVVVFDGTVWYNAGLLGETGVTSVQGSQGLGVNAVNPAEPIVFMRGDWWETTQRDHILQEHSNFDTTNMPQNGVIRWDAANNQFDVVQLLAADAPADGQFYGRMDVDTDGANEWKVVRLEDNENVLTAGLPDLNVNPNSKWLAYNGTTWEHAELELPNTIDFVGVMDAITNAPPAGVPPTNHAYIHSPNDGVINPGWATGTQGIQVGDPVRQGEMLVFSTAIGEWFNAGSATAAVVSVSGQNGIEEVGTAQDPVLQIDRGTVDGWYADLTDFNNHVGSRGGSHDVASATVAGFMSAADKAKLDGLTGTGEANTSSNAGTGAAIALPKAGVDLPFRSLVGGANVTITENANNITIAAAGGAAGESNTSSNVGTGAEIALPKSGVDLPFRTITGGTNVTVTQNANDIVIDAAGGTGGETNTGSSLGGEAIYAGKVGVDLQFKGLVAGNNVTLTPTGNTITIDSAGGGAGGETNTGTALGGDEDVYAGKVGTALQFKGLTAGTNVTLTSTGNDIVINAAGGGGGGGESNTSSNEGAGVGLALPKAGVNLPFKTIVAGANVTIDDNADNIVINSSGGGGGGGVNSVSGQNGVAEVGTATDPILEVDRATVDGWYAPIAHVGSTNGHPLVTATTDGFMSAADKDRLDNLNNTPPLDPGVAEGQTLRWSGTTWEVNDNLIIQRNGVNTVGIAADPVSTHSLNVGGKVRLIESLDIYSNNATLITFNEGASLWRIMSQGGHFSIDDIGQGANRFCISTGGNVGTKGMIAPEFDVTLNRTDTSSIAFGNEGMTAYGATRPVFGLSTSVGTGYSDLIVSAFSNIRWFTNTTEVMTLDENGNLTVTGDIYRAGNPIPVDLVSKTEVRAAFSKLAEAQNFNEMKALLLEVIGDLV